MTDAPKSTDAPPDDPKGKQPAVESDDDSDSADDAPTQGQPAAASSSSKKKNKKKKKKASAAASNPIADLPPNQIAELLSKNPALANEFASMSGGGNDPAKLAQFMKGLSLQDIMTGLAATGKGAKDMASYKFWQTQPVPKFGEDQEEQIEEGPFKVQTLDEVPKKPAGLIDGFEWVTMDLTNEDELKEVYELLNGHYVEDDEAMFRFKYSTSILKWALMAPGWKQQWHTGVRASQSRKLVAFISAIPIELRVRNKTLHASEVNFLCVHKKLRGKRLSPVLIKEITRLCNLEEVWQAIYTAGVVLPKPVSTCRYFHRAINWQKLYEVGFSPLPSGSKPQYQVRKYALPDHTATKGLRPMEAKDVDAVQELLQKYLARFHLAPEFTREEIEHWLLDKNPDTPDQVVYSYVVEKDGKVTDFFSYYSLESSVINSSRHSVIRAAYMFYYATDVGIGDKVDKEALGKRLNQLVSDALILSKRKFDVFNALSLMDNALFLEQQKFGPGDGQLHYYLFNYKANSISGGIDRKNQLDQDSLSGVGVVML